MQSATNLKVRTSSPTDFLSLVTFTVTDQSFGIPVTEVQDVLILEAIANVPLGPKDVRGLINLRGRIVTVIDVRARLGLPPRTAAVGRAMGVTVESEGEFYTLLVDAVGDVVQHDCARREANPATLDLLWRDIADGIFTTDDTLLVVLNVARLLAIRTR